MSDQQSWFIDPGATVDLPLEGLPPQKSGEPHYITVKRELSFAEASALEGAIIGDFTATGRRNGSGKKAEVLDASMPMDMRKFKIERFAAWIVGWSAVMKKGDQFVAVPVNRDTIAQLRGPFADAIDAALDQHIDALEAEKKVPSGTTAARSSSS